MWLSGQQKRPAQDSGGQTGVVTMSGGELAVQLDSERRELDIYGPAGYRWTPKTGQRVLVIQGKGEAPCVVGVRQGEDVPCTVSIAADRLELSGRVKVNGVELGDYIAQKVMELTGGKP